MYVCVYVCVHVRVCVYVYVYVYVYVHVYVYVYMYVSHTPLVASAESPVFGTPVRVRIWEGGVWGLREIVRSV